MNEQNDGDEEVRLESVEAERSQTGEVVSKT